MNNVLNLMPRIRAKQAAQEDCSHFYDDMVVSDKALDRITRELARIDDVIKKAEYKAVYWDGEL